MLLYVIPFAAADHVFGRSTERWGVIIPSFTHTQWVQNFRTSEETYTYLCNKCHGEAYDDEWDAPAAAEPGVAVAQGAEEEGRDMRYLNT